MLDVLSLTLSLVALLVSVIFGWYSLKTGRRQVELMNEQLAPQRESEAARKTLKGMDTSGWTGFGKPKAP